MKAVLLNFNGGGAISPFCYDVVAVVPVAALDTLSLDRSSQVFSGDCDSFELDETTRTIENSPFVEWLAPDKLRIVASSKRASGEFPRTIAFRGQDATRSVRVEFTIRDHLK